MTRTLAQRIVLCGLGLTLVLGPLGVALAGPTEGGFHWARKPSQFTLQVGENLDGPWQTIFRRAVSDWNAGGTVTFRAVNGSSNPQECRPTNGQVEVCNGRYGTQEGWLGLTRLYFDNRGEHIESATVQLNDSFFDQANGIYQQRCGAPAHHVSRTWSHTRPGSCQYQFMYE